MGICITFTYNTIHYLILLLLIYYNGVLGYKRVESIGAVGVWQYPEKNMYSGVTRGIGVAPSFIL